MTNSPGIEELQTEPPFAGFHVTKVNRTASDIKRPVNILDPAVVDNEYEM